MAHSRISDDQMAAQAAEIFRRLGYEGTSLETLASAMGVHKASLYYRYPAGKSEIVLAAAGSIGRWFEENLFAPLREPGMPSSRQIALISKRLREFYADGSKPCVLDTLSLAGGSPELAAALRLALERWMEAFAAVARLSGFPAAQALRRAEDAIICIEGALVLSRVTGDGKPFLRVVAGLGSMLSRE